MESELAGLWLAQWQAWQPKQAMPDLGRFLLERSNAKPADKLAVILQDQRFRWRTPQPLRVEDYLQQVPELRNDDERLLQLVVGEFQSRLNGDTVVSIDEYTARFSDLSETLRNQLQQVASDSKANPAIGDLATSSNVAPTIEHIPAVKHLEIDHHATVSSDPSSLNLITRIGCYRRMRLLGEGAFGFVWLGMDEELQRHVAIKVPKPERFRGPEDAEQYLAEARMVAGLDHPHIVPVYDVGRTETGSIYVVSKFIEGCTLADRLKQPNQKISHEEITKLLATAAQALHHAHEHRLIHRDVKPANILIEERTGTTYVADFGLAIREEDYLRDSRLAGTPAYMSPEQARGEGHRLDGRSDIFSLGVMMYEMLTGKRPFRGSTTNELLHQVVSVEPATPRTLDDTIPAELDRICLKALSKRAADRYATGNEIADDLSHWQQGPEISVRERVIVPKGLRSFDADDADFFLDLLPGPRDRDGLPESIRFWKKRIEETDPERTFSVGLIYGPSGCGKSSLVKAGLIPRLSKDIVAIYIEATPDDTETRILRALHTTVADLPTDLTLPESFAWLRRRPMSGKALSAGSPAPKIVIILDQFEQWLHSHRSEQETDLVTALRQCDGGQLQAIAMVRDDFALAASRFMRELETRILEGHNFATVDLFDVDHAEQVLVKFGRAFGKLPANSGSLSADQQAFVSAVASGLANDGKVVSVRLSLFAEMIKGKPWTLQTLTDVGGTQGIGVNFLEDMFSSRGANPEYRAHEQAARAVLKSLLPDVATDIKGHMRSHAELLADSGYESRPADFNTLLRILDGELRLITPTDPEGLTDSSRDSSLATRYYQLTHDYMVPSLRDWLTRKQQETRAGRAELKLAERTNLWTAKPENRYLPSIGEWGSIRTLTDRAKWTSPQRVMMRRAGRVHSLRWGMGLAVALLVGVTTQQIYSTIERRNLATRAKTAVASLNSSRGIILPPLASFEEFPRELLTEELRTQFAESADNRKLPLAYARSHFGDVDIDFLVSQVEQAQPEEGENFATAFGHDPERTLGAIEAAAKQCDKLASEALANAAKTAANAAWGSEENDAVESVWRYKARLSMLNLHLGSPALAADMCQLRPDPIQRTVFVDECSSWSAELHHLSLVVGSSDDADLRSAICLVVGGVPLQQVTSEQQKVWEAILTDWYQHQHDTSTHSASGWALRKWGVPLPALAVSESAGRMDQQQPITPPSDLPQWRVNGIGLTMLRIPAGQFQGENDDGTASVIEVTHDFFLSDREITVGQFQQFIDDPNYPADEKPKDWMGVNTYTSPVREHSAQQLSWYHPAQQVRW